MVPHHKPPPLGSANKFLTTTMEDAPKCPRCDSSNTKFCYYNNYSLSQPRYFCKGCRRYWTKGGSLRNVPVGGGVRSRNRRGSRFIRPPMNRPLRPDMMLDHHDGLYNETDHGSTDIDLAALYNKFLNQGHDNNKVEYSSRVVGCDDQLVLLDGVGNENDLLWSSCPILGGSGSMWMQQSQDIGNGLLCSSLFGGNWSGLDYSGSTFEPFSTT